MKRLRNLLVCALLAMALLLTPALAFAQSPYSMRIDSIQHHNDACILASDALTACGLEIVRQANLRIEEIIEQSIALAQYAHSDAELDCIISSMLLRTTAVSRTAQVVASLCGVKTVCEYVPVTIGGRTVSVDPLRVVLV